MNTASTKPMNIWEDKFWHHRVHQRLGEILFYYLVRVRPLDSEQVKESLKTLLKDKQLGTVRVFPIFGSYDFLIRAWLHPSNASQFRNLLDAKLAQIGSTRAAHPFSVDYIDKRWHNHTEINRDLLEDLDEGKIQAVQTGQDPPLLQKLLDNKLILDRQPTNNINFFITINIEQGNNDLHVDLVSAVKEYLSDTPEIRNVSIYRGFGFCTILIKGQVQNYFCIAPLPNWIGKTYKPFGAHTDTHLVHGLGHIIGDEKIGQATFYALQGRDLFVQSIIPELYDTHSTKKQGVERILIDEAHKHPLTQRDKKLLHDYLLGYLNDATTEMAKALFTKFYELEAYLRNTLNEFIGRKTKGSVKEMLNKAHVPESNWDRPTLRDALSAYSLTIRETDQTGENTSLVGGWEKLADLRNDIIHGNVDILPNWESILKTFLPYLTRIQQLLTLVESVTNKPYSGIY